MFGLRFIKMQPTSYLLQYKKGRIVREGAGLSFFYYAPTSSLVAVPIASTDAPFIFNEVTSDFQEISIQGQANYRITDPKRVSQLLNYTLGSPNNVHVRRMSKSGTADLARIVTSPMLTCADPLNSIRYNS